MSNAGSALMAIGHGSGEGRAAEAARVAVSSPLLDIDINGAKGILFNITSGEDLTLFEVNEASSIIREAAHEDANIIFGAVIDETMRDEMKITVIATGFDKEVASTAGMGMGDAALPGQPPRYAQRPGDDPSRTGTNNARADDLEIPTFIRKKAD
jgi:cell division protein FtsZ